MHEPLAFIGKTLEKYVKNSLKYRTFMKTHFNSDKTTYFQCLCILSFVHGNSSLLLSDNVNFQHLKDVIVAAQLETNGTSFKQQKM